jgi:hypothetical protein
VTRVIKSCRLGLFCSGKLRLIRQQTGVGNWSDTAMRRTTLRRLLYLVYIIIGIIVAWEHHYITVAFLKTLLSAILAILLWWLVLLGVSLHIH